MMRSPIPPAIREQLADDPWMSKCALKDYNCDGRIEWHHAFKYAGKRQNFLWALIPLCKSHHAGEAIFLQDINRLVRKRIKHFHAEEDFRAKFPHSTLLPK